MACLILPLCLISISLAAAPAQAELYAYDRFDYRVDQPTSGQRGRESAGFADLWRGEATFETAEGSLDPPSGEFTGTGNHVTAASSGGNRNLSRTLAEPLNGNRVFYVSFVMQPEGTVGEGYYHGWFGVVLRAGDHHLTIGRVDRSATFGIGQSGGNQDSSGVHEVSGEPHLFVVRVELKAGPDEITLYIDPLEDEGEPEIYDAHLNELELGSLQAVSLSGPGAFSVDELRIGETWEDVTGAFPGDE